MDFFLIGANYWSSGIFAAIFRRVRFHEKVRKRVQELSLNRAKAARDVDLPESTISNYMTKVESLPRIDIALKISRALDVPLHWLADDELNWPPPASALASATNEQLTAELGRRLRMVGIMLLESIEQASKIDWISVAEQLLQLDPDEPLPDNLRSRIELPGQIRVMLDELLRFNPRTQIGQTPSNVLKDFKPDFEISLIALFQWTRNARERPGFSQASTLGALWILPGEYRRSGFKEYVEQMRSQISEELKAEKSKAAKR